MKTATSPIRCTPDDREGRSRHRSDERLHQPDGRRRGVRVGGLAVGLIVWIVYVVTDTTALAWTAFGLLVVIALLGFTMLIRWLPTYRGRTVTAKLSDAITGSGPAEGHFPVAAVAGHGLLAVTTVVLVLLAAAGVGS